MEYESRGVWKPAPHLEVLCNELMIVEDRIRKGVGDRVMVFMPPRHGKSEVVSKKGPAWILGRNPSWEVLLTSYAAELSYDFSRIARDTLREQGPKLWNVRVNKASSAVGRWGIAGTRGGLMAAGVGGPITGRGAHLAIIDDPFKNFEDAQSETIREQVWNWYRSTLRTRLAPGAAIVLVMTRWHTDDLAGRLLREAELQSGESWRVISFPARATGSDVLGRSEGQVLWPARFSEEEYTKTEQTLGSYLWSSLYQQSPVPDGGALFRRDWFNKVVDRAPDGLRWVRYWDLATSTKESADWTVGALVGTDREGNLWIRDIIRKRLEWPDTRRLITATALQDGRNVQIGIEKVAFQLAAWQDLMRERVLLSHRIRAVAVDKSKEMRAVTWAARAEAGKVTLVRGSWIPEFLSEVETFPYGKHDDQVDAVSGAVAELAGRRGLGAIPKPSGY